jgi:hypothetical protein
MIVFVDPTTPAVAHVEPARRYDPPHILWYFGALTAALAANATVVSVSASARGTYQLLVGLVLMAVFAVGAALLLRSGWRVPGGVLAVTAVLMVPTVGQAFERLIGVWPSLLEEGPEIVQSFEGALFALGLATVAAGLGVFAAIRFPFLFATVTVPLVFTAQFLLPGLVDDPSVNDRASCLIVTGLVLALVGFVLDSVGRSTDAFWWHATGLFTLGLGLAYYAFVRSEDWAWIAILLIAAALLLASAPFHRATWATIGVAGVFVALLRYVTDWFGSWKAASLMVLVSVGLLLLGMALQLYAQAWEARLGRQPPVPPSTKPAPEPPPEPDAAPPEEPSSSDPPTQPTEP